MTCKFGPIANILMYALVEVMLSRKFNVERAPGVISDVHGPLRPVATHITLSRWVFRVRFLIMLLSTMMVKKTAFSEWKNSLNQFNFFCIHLRQKLCEDLKSAKVVDIVWYTNKLIFDHCLVKNILTKRHFVVEFQSNYSILPFILVSIITLSKIVGMSNDW